MFKWIDDKSLYLKDMHGFPWNRYDFRFENQTEIEMCACYGKTGKSKVVQTSSKPCLLTDSGFICEHQGKYWLQHVEHVALKST